MATEKSTVGGVVVDATGGVVAVRIPDDTTVDRETAAAVNEAYLAAVRRDGVDAALTVVGEDVSLTGGAAEALRIAVAAGYDLGVDRWGVVAADPDAAASFVAHIEGIDARTFDSEAAARAWLTDA